MTNELDQLLSDRLARLAPKGDEPDWSNVLRRAGRLGGPARPRGRRRALLLAAALVAAFAVAGAALALSGAGTGVPAIDRLLDRASTHAKPTPVGAPPQGDFHAQPGSVSKPLELHFDGIDYAAVGFRSRSGMICSALVNPASEVEGGVGCTSVRLLHRALEDDPFFVSGGGGGRHLATHGFARASVASMALAGGRGRGAVELSDPWRPEHGAPIRFFYVITEAPADVRPRSPLLPAGMRIEARRADGRLIDVQP